MTISNIKLHSIQKSNTTLQKSTPDAKKVLRPLSDSESFYFYRAVEEPLGEKATSLPDFLNKLQTVDTLSVAFHFYRGDFERWIRNTIGDLELASELAVTERTTLKDEALRDYVIQRVKTRFKDYKVKVP